MWLAAVGSAALSVYAGQKYLGGREAALHDAARASLAGRSVIVAAHGLAAGSEIAAADLALREVPVRFLPSGYLQAAEAAALVGRRIRVARQAGEALQRLDIETDLRRDLSSHVAPGQRAVTLAVDELGALSGLLKPGDEVDLYYVPGRNEGDVRIGLLMSRVLVLATGSRTLTSSQSAGDADDSASFSAITLQLSPVDAERLALAQRAGQVLPVLRKPGDEPTVSAGIRLARELFQAGHPAAPGRSRQKALGGGPLSLEVIAGGQGSVIAGRDSVPLEDAAGRTGGR
jgi:pilus assembly protein CpaB